MKLLKRLFDFYLNSSIHIGMSCYALVRITHQLFEIPFDAAMAYFAFFGTIVGYNFVKYDAMARSQKVQMSNQLKGIAFLSSIALGFTMFNFFQMEKITKLVALFFLILTLLYTLPFFPNKKNARNWAGVKIYIVALCWVGVTLFLPVINAQRQIDLTIIFVAIQRFILIFVLILIFEIIDLRFDDPHLKTVPQQIGVNQTKILGSVLLLVFILMEFLNCNFNYVTFFLKLGIAIVVLFFLFFSNEKRSKYYTSFWVESIPIFWWVLIVVLK